jgi:hypothetical protein
MASEPARKYENAPNEANDSPQVAALRKRIRGEALSAAERDTLEASYRKPRERTVAHAVVMRELAERRHRGG